MPALANMINKQILTFAQLNILPSNTVNAIDNSILNFGGINDGPLNDNFNNLGYGSMNAIENMGSSFIFLIATCFIYCILMLLGLFSSEGVPDKKRYNNHQY